MGYGYPGMDLNIPHQKETELLLQALAGLGRRPYARVLEGERVLFSCFKVSVPEYLESELKWVLGQQVNLSQFTGEGASSSRLYEKGKEQ